MSPSLDRHIPTQLIAEAAAWDDIGLNVPNGIVDSIQSNIFSAAAVRAWQLYDLTDK